MFINTKNTRGHFIAAINTFADGSPGAGDPIEVSDGYVTVQFSGDATDLSYSIQRSTMFPGADGSLGNWAQVDAAIADADLTAGTLSAVVYIESDHAWWRVNVTTCTGGSATSSVSGKQAE